MGEIIVDMLLVLYLDRNGAAFVGIRLRYGFLHQPPHFCHTVGDFFEQRIENPVFWSKKVEKGLKSHAKNLAQM
jgi:hypothetical protein